MPVRQLFYISRASAGVSSGDVEQISSISRRNNYRDDVTGCLLFTERSFAQVLEGEADAVQRVFDRVRGDARHHGVRVLLEHDVAGRRYTDWSMGFVHSLDLDDELQALLASAEADPDAVGRLLAAMRPDTIFGQL